MRRFERRKNLTNVAKLQAAIQAYISEYNQDARAFQWTARTEVFLEEVRQARTILDWMQIA